MRKIILDVDTGTDDAIAIMAAVRASQLELTALCSVHGNAAVEHTTKNTLNAAYAAGGGTIPVYPGAADPMVKNLIPSRANPVEEPILSGTTEINGVVVSINPDLLPLKESPYPPQEKPAALFYVEELRSREEKVTIVATGAMTNLGLALRLDPRITEKIEEIVIMGGGVQKTNITAAAEANFFKDPEAAAIVLDSGVPITICTLDGTHSCGLTEEHEKRLRGVGTLPAIFTANDVRVRRESYSRLQPLEREGTAPIHDALCIAYLIDPAVATRTVTAACKVDCSDGISEGRLQVDGRHFREGAEVHLILEADPDKLCDILVDTFLEEG
ncbi:MAG: nucleoside hydrolase [Oscillospiraceae bacterium]|nr:nucleoside hydrolase [Oscillospiraceae bacterium]